MDTKEMSASKEQVGGSHYSQYKIQPKDFIKANRLGWDEANAVKYIVRHRDKGGVEDIKKAIHYLEMLLEDEYEIIAATAYSDDSAVEDPDPPRSPSWRSALAYPGPEPWTWQTTGGPNFWCQLGRCDCALADLPISLIRDCPHFDHEV